MKISMEVVSILRVGRCQLKWSWMFPDQVRAQTLKDRKYSLADQAGRQELCNLVQSISCRISENMWSCLMSFVCVDIKCKYQK